MSDFGIFDATAFSILMLCVIIVFPFAWGRYLSKLDSRYQTLMDIIAIILSGLVILSFATGWIVRALGHAL